jgi:hypothetical protein
MSTGTRRQLQGTGPRRRSKRKYYDTAKYAG